MRVQSFTSSDTYQSVALSILFSAAILTYGSAGITNVSEDLVYSSAFSTSVFSLQGNCDTFVDQSAKDWIRFEELTSAWRRARGVRSSVGEIITLVPYQKIIGMGEAAVPLILASLRAEGDDPDLWFWALQAITDANPVRAADQGNFRLMAQAWLEWGEREGYARNVATA